MAAKGNCKGKDNCGSLDCDARHRSVDGWDAQFALRDGGKGTHVFSGDDRLGLGGVNNQERQQ
jgi:hypothetical protein